MDAFGSAHRAHASTCGVVDFCPHTFLGPLFTKEMNILSKVIKNADKPLVSIIGGSKISTKFDVLNTMAGLSDYLIVGGGIANTFIATEYDVGSSLYEQDFVDQAKYLKEKYGNILVPSDVRVGTSFCKDA